MRAILGGMALTSTLYRFQIDLSDIDRGVYDTLELRLAMHPSESMPYLITRMIAYALNWQEGLEVSPGGLSDSDQPALRIPGQHGSTDLWIEIGNPSARKLHKAAKASRKVKVYTYKDPHLLLEEIRSNRVHQAEQIEILSLPLRFLNRVAEHLERDNTWGLMFCEGTLTLTVGEESESAEVGRHTP